MDEASEEEIAEVLEKAKGCITWGNRTDELEIVQRYFELGQSVVRQTTASLNAPGRMEDGFRMLADDVFHLVTIGKVLTTLRARSR